MVQAALIGQTFGLLSGVRNAPSIPIKEYFNLKAIFNRDQMIYWWWRLAMEQ